MKRNLRPQTVISVYNKKKSLIDKILAALQKNNVFR